MQVAMLCLQSVLEKWFVGHRERRRQRDLHNVTDGTFGRSGRADAHGDLEVRLEHSTARWRGAHDEVQMTPLRCGSLSERCSFSSAMICVWWSRLNRAGEQGFGQRFQEVPFSVMFLSGCHSVTTFRCLR